MIERPWLVVRRFYAGLQKIWKKNSSSKRRSRSLIFEALEDRLTPSAGVQEQYMLSLINRFRENPTAELQLILNANDPNVAENLSYFGVNETTLAQQFAALSSEPPLAPLAWNDDLAAAALTHSQNMLATQDQDHQVTGEPTWTQRILNAGYSSDYSNLAENIYAFANSVFEAEAAFVIDWGDNPPSGIQNPPGHRDNLLSSDLREVGVGLVTAPSGSPMGPLLVTQDFGNRPEIVNPFLLGTVFDDLNGDGFYEPGEGLGGATIYIVGTGSTTGTFQTESSAAGGYQIELPAGTYQVTASGGGLPTPIVQNVTVGQTNVEADFIEPQLVAPTFSAPAASSSNTAPAITWNAIYGATSYDLWVSDISTGQGQIIRQQSLPSPTYTPATPLSAGNYQAWVRVTTAMGTSSWSATYSFTITPPAVPTFDEPAPSTSSTTPTIGWSAPANAATYDLWVDNESTGQLQIIRQSSLATNSYTPGSALSTGTYEAWVQAFNNAGNSSGWSAGYSFTITAPLPPTLNGPAADITTTTPTFSWTSTGAAYYDLWVNNQTTGQIQIIRQTLTTNSYTPATPIPRGQYIFWVRAGTSATVFGAWSAGYSFLIDTTAPAIPTINGPTSPTPSSTSTISWSNTDAATYDLWVSNISTGQGQIIRQTALATNSYLPATPLPLGNYVAWVRAFDSGNNTRGWSASYYFTITAPAAPINLGPVGSTANTTPQFTWASVTGAVTYDLWVDDVTTNTIQVIRQTSLATNSYTPAAALPLGSYRFWVRAFDAYGAASIWSAEDDFTVT